MTKNPQKLIAGRYHVVPRTLIFIFDNDRVLLQKGALQKKIWAGLYNGLGGHVEKGEDVLSSARRELLEEAGIECPDLQLHGTVMIDVNELEGILMFIFSGHHPRGVVRGSEEGTPEWVRLDQVGELPVVEDIPMIIEKVLQPKEARPFFGHYSYDEIGKLKAVFN